MPFSLSDILPKYLPAAAVDFFFCWGKLEGEGRGGERYQCIFFPPTVRGSGNDLELLLSKICVRESNTFQFPRRGKLGHSAQHLPKITQTVSLNTKF